MDIKHHMDHDNRIIITVCSGEASNHELLEGIGYYQQQIRSDPSSGTSSGIGSGLEMTVFVIFLG